MIGMSVGLHRPAAWRRPGVSIAWCRAYGNDSLLGGAKDDPGCGQLCGMDGICIEGVGMGGV